MPKQTEKQIISKDPYRSIINLVKYTPFTEGKRTGASFNQIYTDLVGKGCINEERKGVRPQLAEQLKWMVDHRFLERGDRKEKKKTYLYYWTGKEVYIEHVEWVISRYRSYRREDMVSDFDFLRHCRKTERFFLSPGAFTKGKKKPSYFSLFGISAKEISRLSKHNQDQVFQLFCVIDDTLRKIQKKGSSGSLDFHWHC